MLPKTIWMYWHQGFDEAPIPVKPCVLEWQKLHPEWSIKLLDQHNINKYVDELPISKNKLNQISLPHLSDLYRTQLLIKYGGVWADPTTFPLQRLEDWVLENMQAGFFMFYKPGKDRIISNWFIATEKNNKILKILYKELIQYWNTNSFKNLKNYKTSTMLNINRFLNRNLSLTRLWFSPVFTKILRLSPYMVYHFMFYRLLCKHHDLKLLFHQMPKVSNPLLFAFNKSTVYQPLTATIKTLVDHKSIPMVKLPWRYLKDGIPKQSNIAYLLNHFEEN